MKTEHKSNQKLLGTATELIGVSSYGSISVDDICDKAGVRKGSLHHFFKSKSDLTTAAMENRIENMRDGIMRLLGTSSITPADSKPRLSSWPFRNSFN